MKFTKRHLLVGLISCGLTSVSYSWWLAPIPVYEIPDAPTPELHRMNREMQLSQSAYQAAVSAYRESKRQHGRHSLETRQALQKVQAAKKEYRRLKHSYEQAEEAWLNGSPVEKK